MAGKGPPPKDTASRRRSNAPARGEWRAAPGEGWQHGAIPEPPAGLRMPASAQVWTTWFRSWFAANWGPENVPQLSLTIQYWDQVQRAIDEPFVESDTPKGGVMYVRRPAPMTELRQHMDNLGITLKGQQDRRWEKPRPAAPKPKGNLTGFDPRDAYSHLRSVK